MLPTSDEQIRFLGADSKRRLDEGLFVAMYKFALLQSLADVAIEQSDDFDASVAVPTGTTGLVVRAPDRYNHGRTSGPVLRPRSFLQVLVAGSSQNSCS